MPEAHPPVHWPFDASPACIGMVHLPPLPGSPQSVLSISAIGERAVEEARMLADAGCDGVMVENFGDVPFFAERVEPHTLTAMAVIVAEIRGAVAVPIGVNVLRNDARGALAVAAAAGGRFIRVNVHTGVYVADQGLIEGRAAETLRYRRELAADVAVFADVHVKHASPLGASDLAVAAEDAAYRGLADALIVSGPTTGRATSIEDVRTVKRAVPDRPVLVGSGVSAENVAELWELADGVIIGSSLKVDGVTTNPIDPDRLDAFMHAVGR
ncbi:MAG: BtpA/SgcQ family protein [Phycisphaerae bacterium]|nr:BtpA/SgcQ family protein [Phycisphaerae bacterium]